MILTCPQCQTRYQTDAARFGADGRNVRCAKCGHVWHQMAEAPPDVAIAPPPVVPQEEPVPAPQAAATEETAPPPELPPELPPESPPESSAESPPPVETSPEPAPVPPPAYAYAAPTPPQRNIYAYAEHSRGLEYEHDAEFPAEGASVAEPPPPPVARRRGDPVRTAAGWVGLVALVVALSWSALHFREAIAMLWPRTASFYAAIGRPVNTRGLEIRDVRTVSESENGQDVLAITGRLANITGHELSVPPIRITLTDDDKRVLYNWSFSAAVATLKPGEAVNFATRVTGPPLGARHMQVQFADSKE